MAGVLTASGCDRTSTASPDTPDTLPRASTTSPSTTQDGSNPLTAAQVFRRGQLKSYASRNGLETLTVWELCTHSCRQHWVLSPVSSEPVVGDAGAGAIPEVTASRSAYVVKAFGRPGFVVRPDGTTLPMHEETAPPQQVSADTVLLRTRGDQLTAVDPARGATWQLPTSPEDTSILEAAVSGSGAVWAIPHQQGASLRILRFRDGRWRSVPMRGRYPADLIQQDIATTARSPTRIAVVATYGRAMTPASMLLVSSDAGRSWQTLADHDLPFRPGDSMAIAGNTLYVAGTGGRIWRTGQSSWTRLKRVPGLRGVVGLQPAGNRVIGWRWRRSELVSIDDQTGRVQVIAFGASP